MQRVFSFLYAPFIVYLLHVFAVRSVAIGILCFGSVWFLSTKEKALKNTIFPLFYIAVALGALIIDDSKVFLFLPLLLSLAFLFFLILGYVDNESIILTFARKMHKEVFSEKEEAYIVRSTRFWIFLSLVNIVLHVSVLLLQDIRYWMFYASVGWYFLFGLGAVLQYLHRRFIFLKEV